jgi:tetrathionate reductase subunit B
MGKVMVIDTTKCVSCYNCQIACKAEFTENDWPPYSLAQPETGQFWMKVQEIQRGTFPKVKVNYVAQPCMQCDEAPCVKAATGGAVYKRPDGIVIIDPTKSVGQKQLVASCPYGAIYWNDKLNIPQKCTFCAHLLDQGWEVPRCVEACQGYAITFGEEGDLKATIGSGAVPLHPELGAKPRVYYIGLPKTFIAGALVDKKTGDCLSGADVTVKDVAAGTTTSTKSNFLGDFWFEGLDANKTYEVTISKAGMTTITRSVTLAKDTDLGDIEVSTA